ncbi:MAG: CBS domain-containing protein [Pseudomonadota bacterium]
MRNSIMTEKIARRGVRVSSEYAADLLDQLLVKDSATRQLVTFDADTTADGARAWLASGAAGSDHQGYPVVERDGRVIGLLTRRDLLAPAANGELRRLVRRAPVVVFMDSSLRQALDQMLAAGVGRLMVVERAAPTRAVGILTRSDLLGAHHPRRH